MDLQQIRRDLRARLSVYTPEWPMTVRPSIDSVLSAETLDAAQQVAAATLVRYLTYRIERPL